MNDTNVLKTCYIFFIVNVIYFLLFVGGRRNGVCLAQILQFTTGSEEEPVLGFTISPCLKFLEAGTSFLPTANTCICSLNLPHATSDIPLPEPQHLFGLYDLAFSNAFFGHV